MRSRLSLACLCALILGAASACADTVTVFAAASLGPALTEAAQVFEGATGHDVSLSLAGSSALARQIGAGAPADLFLSASSEWMDWVEGVGALTPDTRVDLLGNRLVLAGPVTTAPFALSPDTDLRAMLGDGLLAMALVDSVPAGQYGRAALQALGLWDGLSPVVAQTENVRAALALITRGEVPMGVVYASDLVGQEGLHALATFDASLHPPIVYPLALTAQASDAADRAFWQMLQSPEAAAIFARHGLIPLGPS